MKGNNDLDEQKSKSVNGIYFSRCHYIDWEWVK